MEKVDIKSKVYTLYDKDKLLEEKNEKEIDEYNNGKGLKRRI